MGKNILKQIKKLKYQTRFINTNNLDIDIDIIYFNIIGVHTQPLDAQNKRDKLG